MIRRPAPSPRHPGPPPEATTATPAVLVPAWLRGAVADAQGLARKDVEDIALVVGAALGALDTVIRREERWAGAWRQRLALSAAAVTARQVGRVEGEGQLRDAVLLTKPGDDVGPAGRLLTAWRRLAGGAAEGLLAQKTLAVVVEGLGHAPDDEAVGDLANDLRQLDTGAGTVSMIIGAFAAAERTGFGRVLGAWLADALLARRLGWRHGIPLLGTAAALRGSAAHRRRGLATGAPSAEMQADRTKALLVEQAQAALRAIDLSAELGRRAGKLLAVAPKLRAKAANSVVEKLLSDDAVIASERIAGMSDRALRRLFDRLVDLDAVRELTGRPTFRIYGL